LSAQRFLFLYGPPRQKRLNVVRRFRQEQSKKERKKKEGKKEKKK
jgi:hypothetical protein